MLLVEILRNVDMYKEDKYITYHLTLKNITINMKLYFLPGIFLFLCITTLSTEMYRKNYINTCYTKNSTKYKELYKHLFLKESALPCCLLEIQNPKPHSYLLSQNLYFNRICILIENSYALL